MKGVIIMSSLTYTQVGDYLLPNITLSNPSQRVLNKYGRMRLTYLQEYKPILYNHLLLNGTLYPQLWEMEDQIEARLEQMLPQLAKAAGATEQLKASDPLKWVGLMNNCKAQAEEILLEELIYN